MKRKTEDRPQPKPRKLPGLWQSYLWWNELVETRKRHELRAQACERGDSNLDAQTEREIMSAMALDTLITSAKRTMVNHGESAGPVWAWITNIRGLKEGGLAAQVIAQIDDIAKFDTVSKLWRFAGYAVIDGQREYNQSGEKSHYNRRLKSIVYLIIDQFIKQNTPLYRDIYDADKARLRRIHPEAIKTDSKLQYNDGHLHAMAMRKTAKIFLQHLWVIWREANGLPVSMPYIHAIGGHTHLIEAPTFEDDPA